MNHKKSIEATKRGFEDYFQEKKFYNRQTQDEKHLEKILGLLDVKPGMKVLDLGTGTGYLAFPMAEKYKEVSICGLDIVEKALEENRKRATEKQLSNLSFINYDGVDFPLEAEQFDWITARYTLHHFPDIQHTFQEMGRVLKPGGKIFISDPTPNENDTERFVDAYMQMKKDGHIKFYTLNEFCDLAEKAGLGYKSHFMTSIRFPKRKKDAGEFFEIMKRYSGEITDGYDIQVQENEIYITEQVLNIVFEKK